MPGINHKIVGAAAGENKKYRRLLLFTLTLIIILILAIAALFFLYNGIKINIAEMRQLDEMSRSGLTDQRMRSVLQQKELFSFALAAIVLFIILGDVYWLGKCIVVIFSIVTQDIPVPVTNKADSGHSDNDKTDLGQHGIKMPNYWLSLPVALIILYMQLFSCR